MDPGVLIKQAIVGIVAKLSPAQGLHGNQILPSRRPKLKKGLKLARTQVSRPLPSQKDMIPSAFSDLFISSTLEA